MTQRGIDLEASKFATAWTVNNPPYVILKWSIENFASAQNLIKSPCFDVSHTSKWNLLLDPNFVVEGDSFVVICLSRNPKCPRPARLMIKGELSVHGPLNELIFDKLFEEIYDSESNNSIEFRLAKICFSLTKSGGNLPDTYLVRCEMIVSEEMNSSNAYKRLHLEKLSSDFQRLYQENKITDLTIRASDDVIGVHKAVLSARSVVLSDMLNNTSGNHISENETNTILGAVLLFIYTGNPDLLLMSIPLEFFGSVASIAAKWGLGELENILTPVKMHCKTRINYRDFLYTWKLKNFNKLPCDAKSCIHSSEFSTDEDTKTKWKLILEKNSDQSIESYGLYITKLYPDNVSHKIDVELRMYNRESKYNVTRRREYTVGPRNVQKFGFSSFSDKYFLQSRILKNNILNIDCKMKFRYDSESWIDFQAKLIDISDEDSCSVKYLKTLSRNLKDLHESNKFLDLTIFANGEALRVHRAILWARCPYLAAKLSHISEQYISVPIDSKTLKEVLLYVYAAELPTLYDENSLKLYSASLLLQIMELWHVCRQYIMFNLNVNNVLVVIVMAHENSDTELENAAIEFASIPGNAKLLINTQKWRTFRAKYADLAIRIYHNLAWAYCNHVCIR